MNIVDPILFQCKWQPLAHALCAPGSKLGVITYGRLEKIIFNIGRKAREEGLLPGNVAVLFIKDPMLHYLFILGLSKIGVVTVSARDLHLPPELRVQAFIADWEVAPSDTTRAIMVNYEWLDGDGRPLDDLPGGSLSLNDPCRIILTSGTTGNPKAVARSTNQMLLRLHRMQTVYGSVLPDCSRVFMDMGFATGLAYSFLLWTLSRGGTLFIRSESAIRSLEAILAYQVPALVAAPKSLSEIAEASERVPGFHGNFDFILTGGSVVTKALSEHVRARLGSNLVISYGATETGVVASAPAHLIARIEGAVGFVAPGVDVDAVDASGEPVPAGQEGRIRIRSDYLVDGYVGDPDSAMQVFRDGAFFPGDMGVVTPERLLIITGREGARINLGGEKLAPERIEAIVTAFEKVSDSAAFAMRNPLGIDMLGIAVVWKGDVDEPGLREHIQSRLPPILQPALSVPVAAIPRNTSGKIDRAKLKLTVMQHVNDKNS
jgi:acyl-coenzyme A synthetase/AMP-(fatty) acid ligase